jgi:ferredoxin
MFFTCFLSAFQCKFSACNEKNILNDNHEHTKGTIMAHVISDECIACGTCAGICPTEAISEGDGKYVIDAGTCIDCGTCIEECPVSAISAG